MNGGILIWVIGVAMTVLLIAAFFRLSPKTRLQRRPRKTHSRIISKSHRPSVKFSVKVPKTKE